VNIVVGVTGGIAAYKAVAVIRAFVLGGHDVQVVATEAALRFVGKPTLEAISRNGVHTDLYEGVAQVRHVAIGQAADLIVVAPATADFLAKIAAGLADDLLGNTILASRAPLVVAPAMHTEMWHNAATVANMALLRTRGVIAVGPASGQLTGDDSGPGRMAEPDDIVKAALAAVTVKDLAGHTILVTAGGTREPLDPVRFVGNRSSGRQGVAIAVAAAARGADVTLVAANLEIPVPDSVTVVTVGTARELDEAAQRESRVADAVIMAAAVADYRPESVSEAKIKKDAAGDRFTIDMVKNPDILVGLVKSRPAGQILIGFAAETEPDQDALLSIGRAKISSKGCDYLVINRVGWTETFGSATNSVTVLNDSGDIVMEASGDKTIVADRILDLIS
jgi:phosphopantothenoylcysteine decarboxylase / phosphopantothenate---cysteine ligase